MQYRVVAIPIDYYYGETNSDGRANGMTKFDPKLVKKISHSKLIACSTEIGIKNAEKVSKEILIPAFLDAVEKAEGESAEKLNANIVNMYNEIVTALELDKEGEPSSGAPTVEEAPAPAPVEAPAPAPPVARRAGRPVTAPATAPKAPAPAPSAKAPAAPKPEKAKKNPPVPKTFNRWTALGETLLRVKSGTMDDLIQEANKSYVELGGKDNLKESTTVVKCSLSVMDKMGVVTLSEGNFKVN